MQIGFVEPHLRMYGGIRRVVELANHMMDRGHDVTLYHPEGTPCQWLECRARVRPTRDLLQRSHEVLVYNDPNPADQGVVRKARAQLKVFYLLALYEKHLLDGIHPILWLRPLSRMAVTKRALRTADLVLANSTWMHAWLRDVLRIDSRLVIGGINREHFHPAEHVPPGGGEFRILHSGDPRPRKGTEMIRAAVELAKTREPRIEVDTYHGKGAGQPQMAGVYGAADLFVDAQRQAGWNNPVAEAMACGVPVACTDIGGVRDFAFHEQTALLVEPGDYEGLSNAILRLIREPGLRQRLSENALDHVKTFTWERSAERFEEVLEAGLRQERPPLFSSLRQRIGSRLHRVRRHLLQKGIHFDKYDLRGPYHWAAYDHDPIYRRHVDHVVDVLDGGGTLLDVGCGDGLITAHLADAGFDVTGIDVEPTAIGLARMQRPDLKFERQDIFDVDGVFDVAVASEVIEHLPNPDDFLQALRSLFRDRALITTPERDYYSDLDPYHRTEYAYHEYIALMQRHFDRVQVQSNGQHLYAVVAAGTSPEGQPQ